MNAGSGQDLHSLGTGEPVWGSLFQDLCQEFSAGFSGLPFLPIFLATPSRGQQHLGAHACPLGHPGQWCRMAGEAGTERNRRGRLARPVPSGILQTQVSLTCLFARQAPIEHQWAPSRSPGPWGPSSSSLPSGSRSTGHPPSGGPSRVHSLHPLPPTPVPGLCARRPRTLCCHYLLTCPPPPGDVCSLRVGPDVSPGPGIQQVPSK